MLPQAKDPVPVGSTSVNTGYPTQSTVPPYSVRVEVPVDLGKKALPSEGGLPIPQDISDVIRAEAEKSKIAEKRARETRELKVIRDALVYALDPYGAPNHLFYMAIKNLVDRLPEAEHIRLMEDIAFGAGSCRA